MTGSQRWRLALFVGFGTGLLFACGETKSERAHPDLLLISIDTLRADHLGAYGHARSTSPNIDALARSGVVFENAMSTSSWTLPAHASLLTGLYPGDHQLQDDGVRLPVAVPTLAEALRAAGYHTLGVVSHVYVSSAFGLDRGFDHFDDSLLQGGRANPVAETVVDRLLAGIAQAPDDAPVFVFAHFFDPHWPYTPPGAFATRFTDPNYAGPVDGSMPSLVPWFDPKLPLDDEDRRQILGLYDGEIAYLDAQLGRLFAGLRSENTVVVLTADHGEEFREHGQLGHGRTLYEEQLHVPLILSGGSSLPSGARRTDLASLVDVAPTLLALAGAEPSTSANGERPGRSLLAEMDDPNETPTRFAESQRFGLTLRAGRSGRHKLIALPAYGRRDYFDLGQDPVEQRPQTEDPTGGALGQALTDHASRSEQGWHLKLIALRGAQLRAQGTLTTSGRFTSPRHYASENIAGASAKTHRFDLDPEDPSRLRFDLSVANHTAEIVFETEPANAAVRFELSVEGAEPQAGAAPGVYLGDGELAPGGDPFELTRDDPRVAGRVPGYSGVAPGIWIRAVTAGTPGTKSDLSRETRAHLEALGYVDEAEPQP